MATARSPDALPVEGAAIGLNVPPRATSPTRDCWIDVSTHFALPPEESAKGRTRTGTSAFAVAPRTERTTADTAVAENVRMLSPLCVGWLACPASILALIGTDSMKV